MFWSVTISKKYDRRYFFVTAGMRELISKELVVSEPDMFSIEKEVRACKACRIQSADVQGEHECIEACDMRSLPEREMSHESTELFGKKMIPPGSAELVGKSTNSIELTGK